MEGGRAGRSPARPLTRANAQSLVLRQNALEELPAARLAGLGELEYLDLYMNRLSRVEGLGALRRLIYLDLSFNDLRRLGGLEGLSELRELYLVNCKLTEIAPGALRPLRKLSVLELGSNRLRAIEHLDCSPDLERLFLGRNKIAEVAGLAHLRGLRVLSLQCNRIVRVGDGLRALTALEELYLGQNGIEEISGLDTLVRLRVLDLSHNRIRRLSGLRALAELEDLWLNNNFVESFDELAEIAPLQRIATLYLEKNPLQRSADYRGRVLAVFPRLSQLDADEVARPEPRPAAPQPLDDVS